MYDYVSYMACLPKPKGVKADILVAMAEGARKQGANAAVVDGAHLVESRLAGMLGWVSDYDPHRPPHVEFRRQIINSHKNVLCIDSNLFLYLDPANSQWRLSLNGVFPNSANYLNRSPNNLKWKSIQNRLHIDLKPWRFTGDYVLVCLQRSIGWSLHGKDQIQLVNETIERARELHCPVRVRLHPGEKQVAEIIAKLSNCEISTTKNLQDDLKSACRLVIVNSSPAVAAVIEGVPVYLHDELGWSQADTVAHRYWDNWRTPVEFDRTSWIESIADCHWTLDELAQGLWFVKANQESSQL